MNRQKGILYFVLLFIILLVQTTYAVYEDQNDVINWEETLVGKPKIAHFQKVLGRSNLFVATEKNVVANLNLRTKTINWRQVLKNEVIVAMKPFKDYIITISEAESSYIRVWNGQSGNLVNEYVVEPKNKESNNNSDVVIVENNIYALIRGNEIIKINSYQNKQWSQKLNNKTYMKLYNNKNDELIIVGKDIKNKPIITKIDMKDGKIIEENTIQSIIVDNKEPTINFNGKELIILDSKGKLWISDIKAPNTGKAVDMTGIDVQYVKQITQITNLLYSIKTNKNIDMIVKIKDSSITKEIELENNENGLVSNYSIDGKNYLAKVSFSNKKEKVLVEVFDVNNIKGKKMFEINTNYASYGEIVKTYLDAYQIRDGTINYRILTITQDGSIHLYKENTLIWDREEALTEIVDAKFIPLPDKKLLVSEYENEKENSKKKMFLDNFVLRVKMQIEQLKETFGSKKIYKSEELDDDDVMIRDKYGFRQVLLFLSKSGKMVCMDTLSKETLWSRFLGTEINGFNGIKITTVRSSAVKYPPIVAIIGSYLENNGKGNNNKESTVVLNINAITGKNVKFSNKSVPAMTKFPFKVKQSFRLPIEEKQNNIRVLVLVESESKVILHPETPEILKEFKEMDKKYFFNLNDEIGGNTIRGFRIIPGGSEEQPIITTQSTYNITFSNNEKIAAYGFKEPFDHAASLGKVLGNRSVLYKYLNPNVLAVSTIKPSDTYQSELAIYIIDTVKGSILHHSTYEGGGATVSMKPKIIQYENAIVCAFWNHGTKIMEETPENFEKADTSSKSKSSSKNKKSSKSKSRKIQKIIKKGSQLVSFELYESEIENQSDMRKEFSSFEYTQPYIVSRSYLFDHIIRSMGVTTTRNSVANREILLGLDNDEIYGVHQVLLDARRKNSPPTNNDKEEGLIQYKALIAANPKYVVTTTYSVAGVDSILTNPAVLESTSLVLGYGLDLFLTTRSPSETFDILSGTFNKTILVATISIVFFLVLFTNRLIRKNEFKKEWKME